MAAILIINYAWKQRHIISPRIFIQLIDCASSWFITSAHATAFAIPIDIVPQTICLHMFHFSKEKNNNNTNEMPDKMWTDTNSYSWLHSNDTLKYLVLVKVVGQYSWSAYPIFYWQQFSAPKQLSSIELCYS